jgi:hypothetical protein
MSTSRRKRKDPDQRGRANRGRSTVQTNQTCHSEPTVYRSGCQLRQAHAAAYGELAAWVIREHANQCSQQIEHNGLTLQADSPTVVLFAAPPAIVVLEFEEPVYEAPTMDARRAYSDAVTALDALSRMPTPKSIPGISALRRDVAIAAEALRRIERAAANAMTGRWRVPANPSAVRAGVFNGTLRKVPA